MLAVFGLFSNFAIYNAFFTGIYNFRTWELLDMKTVPLPIKIGASTAIAFGMCYKLWADSLYDCEMYRLAVKYRHEYEKEDPPSNIDPIKHS